MSEKISSGTKNPKQTNKQTIGDKIRDYNRPVPKRGLRQYSQFLVQILLHLYKDDVSEEPLLEDMYWETHIIGSCSWSRFKLLRVQELCLHKFLFVLCSVFGIAY